SERGHAVEWAGSLASMTRVYDTSLRADWIRSLLKLKPAGPRFSGVLGRATYGRPQRVGQWYARTAHGELGRRGYGEKRLSQGGLRPAPIIMLSGECTEEPGAEA